jgi:hypothetical protein
MKCEKRDRRVRPEAQRNSSAAVKEIGAYADDGKRRDKKIDIVNSETRIWMGGKPESKPWM